MRSQIHISLSSILWTPQPVIRSICAALHSPPTFRCGLQLSLEDTQHTHTHSALHPRPSPSVWVPPSWRLTRHEQVVLQRIRQSIALKPAARSTWTSDPSPTCPCCCGGIGTLSRDVSRSHQPELDTWGPQRTAQAALPLFVSGGTAHLTRNWWNSFPKLDSIISCSAPAPLFCFFFPCVSYLWPVVSIVSLLLMPCGEIAQ